MNVYRAGISQNANLGTLNTALSFPPLKYWWGWLVGKYEMSYVNSVQRVYEEVNWNESKWNAIPFVETYTYETIARIINAYGNMMLEYSNEELPTYDGKKGVNYNKKTIEFTAKGASVPVQLAEKVIKQLYWATADGRIHETQWIDPRSFLITQGYAEQREDTKTKGWLEKAFIGLLIIACSIGVYYAFKTYKEIKK